MRVICTERSQVLGAHLAHVLQVPVVNVKFSRFPDGEHYLLAGDLDDETVIVGSVVDNDALVQLLLLIDACEPSRTQLVLPYMAYARQDKQFKRGEPLSARVVAKALSRGVSEIFTINIHDPGVLTHFAVPAQNLPDGFQIPAFFTLCRFNFSCCHLLCLLSPRYGTSFRRFPYSRAKLHLPPF